MARELTDLTHGVVDAAYASERFHLSTVTGLSPCQHTDSKVIPYAYARRSPQNLLGEQFVDIARLDHREMAVLQ